MQLECIQRLPALVLVVPMSRLDFDHGVRAKMGRPCKTPWREPHHEERPSDGSQHSDQEHSIAYVLLEWRQIAVRSASSLYGVVDDSNERMKMHGWVGEVPSGNQTNHDDGGYIGSRADTEIDVNQRRCN